MSVILSEALQSHGDNDEVYLNLGLIKRAQGNYIAARDFLLKALEIDPDYQDAKLALADVEAALLI